MSYGIEQIRKDILGSNIDDVTRVHMLKILEGNPTSSEVHVLCSFLSLAERHKLQQKKVDTLMRGNLNQR